jgi:hypothetical protein
MYSVLAATQARKHCMMIALFLQFVYICICEFHWIKPEGSVVNGSNLEIPSLSKNDHGTFTCHAGNGYGNRIYMHFIFADNVRILFMSQSVALHLNLRSMQF